MRRVRDRAIEEEYTLSYKNGKPNYKHRVTFPGFEDISENRSRNRRYSGSVTHRVLRWRPNFHSVSLALRSDPKIWQIKSPRHGWWDPPSPRFDSLSPPVGFLGRAYDAMIPKLENDSNVLVFIKELTGFSQVFESAFKSVVDVLRGKLIRAAAGTNLNYNYGIKTTMSDIQSLVNSYSNFRARIHELNSLSGKRLVHHYSEDVSYPRNVVPVINNGYETWYMNYPEFTAKWTLVAKYRFELQTPIPPTFSNYLNYLGFNRPATGLWDSIPFSFVIDWVLKVSDFLARFDFSAVPCNLIIDDCTMSVKAAYQTNGYTKDNGGTWAYFPLNRNVGGFFHSYYSRWVIFPNHWSNSLSLPRFDKLSIRELVLGASLLAAK